MDIASLRSFEKHRIRFLGLYGFFLSLYAFFDYVRLCFFHCNCLTLIWNEEFGAQAKSVFKFSLIKIFDFEYANKLVMDFEYIQ